MTRKELMRKTDEAVARKEKAEAALKDAEAGLEKIRGAVRGLGKRPTPAVLMAFIEALKEILGTVK